MCYIFHFSCSIIGPGIDFKDFRNFIRMKEEYKEIDYVKVTKLVLKAMGIWCCHMVVYYSGSMFFKTIYMIEPEFGENNMIYKFIYLYLSSFIWRNKFYCGWRLSHTAMSFSGMTYNQNPKTGEVDLNKSQVFDFYGVETEINPKKKLTVSCN